jgi:hypothetical protein
MTAAERARLAELEVTIARDFERVVEVGRALREIRDKGLYRDVVPPTFEAYIEQRWDWKRRRAYQQIDAANIADALCTARTQPNNEWVARELAPLLSNPNGGELVTQAWQRVEEQHEGERPPTAPEVRRILVAEGFRENPGGGSGSVNLRVALGSFGDRLNHATARLDLFETRDRKGRDLHPEVKKLALEYADRCDALAARLRQLGEA